MSNFDFENKINNEDDEIIPVVIVGLDYGNRSDFEHSFDEMKSLVEACNMVSKCLITQNLPHPDPATYIGSGKALEVASAIEMAEAQYCIFEDNLSPAQLKNLQKIINVPIWDRTNLILEIFSRRAKTMEARLQVESAYLQYMLPRLSGMWQHLGRQGGGSGSRSNRGIGETQIELDRRQINHRIAELRKELNNIEKTRTIQRSGRKKGGLPMAALVGYTNAGKSTIMNSSLDISKSADNESKKVLQKDMLFATLDTSIRSIHRDDNRDFLLSDTVGFIENLPHGLVKAFRSTLEEAANADLLLIVIDSSDPFCQEHKKITENTLRELGAGELPRLYIMNKADMIGDRSFDIPYIRDDTIWMNATDEKCINELLSVISDTLYKSNINCSLLIPYDRGDLTDIIHRKGKVISEEYVAEGVRLEVCVPANVYGLVEKYNI